MSKRSDKLKIAIVDDSDFARKAVIEILESEGFNVVGSAGSAEDGIALSATTDANLFLVDVVMPERSGLEMAKVLSEKSMSSIYIIMMSSLNMEKIVIESLSSGAIDFIPKPFTREELIKAVEKIEETIDSEGL